MENGRYFDGCVNQKAMAHGANHGWLRDGGKAVDMEELKKEVECCSKLLSSAEVAESLIGSKRFYDVIMGVWALDTSLAMDAAELVCATIR